MTRLFKRNVRVSIAVHDRTKAPTQENGIFFRYLPGVEIEGLRVRFEAEKTSNDDPNHTEISIFNLNENSRALIQEDPLFVRLEGGYDGNFADIAQGDAVYTKSTRIRDGWESTIELGEGARAYDHARLSKSYKSGTKMQDVIKDLSKSMGLPDPSSVGELANIADQYVSGNAISGPSHKTLTKVLRKHGLSWSIQNNKLRVRSRDKEYEALAILVSQDTGMIGVPELGKPDKKGNPPVLTVRVRLQPEAQPGRLMRLESRNLSGNYVIQQIRHVGDTHGEPWYTEIEATPK